MKRLITLLLLLVVAVMAYQAYSRHLDTQEVAAISTKIRSASIRVINMAAFFKTPGGETYKEVLAFGDASLQEIDGAVLELQSMPKPRKPAVREHAVGYLKACQVAIRNIQEVVRAKMAVEMHADAAGKIASTLQRHVDDPSSLRNRVGADVALYRVDETLEEVRAADSRFDSAGAALQEHLIELVSIKPPATSGLSQDIYVPAEKVDGMKFTIRLKPYRS